MKNKKTSYPRSRANKIIALSLRISVIFMLVFQFFNRNYENVLLCFLTLLLFQMPSLFERRLNIDLPDTLEIVILLFIYAAEILGEIRAFYVQYPHWDTILHTMNGFLCAAIGFSLVDMLNRGSRFSLSLSPFYMSIAAFCFSMTIGVLWEFFEFAMDFFFRFDMQKDTVLNIISTVNLDPVGGVHPIVEENIADVILVYSGGSQKALGLGGFLDIGLFDTMQDLFVNFVGAVIFSVVGYFYVKTRGKGNFAKRFIPRVFTHREIESQNKEEKE